MDSDPRSTKGSHPNCQLCCSPTVDAFSKDGFIIVDCPACGHRTVSDIIATNHLETIYGDDYFFGGGAGYEDYLSEADLLRAQGRRYGELLINHRPPAVGRVLDVGSAAGFLQAGLADAGWTTTGLEPNGTMVANARDELGLDTVMCGLEQAPDLPPFDSVCLIQVIGHFNDLPKAMRALSKLTKPGCICLVEYWRRDSRIAKIFGPNWHEYSPPSVLHWFSRASLDNLMQRYGFGIVAKGIPKKYISLGHAESLLKYKLKNLPGGALATAPLRLLPKTTKIRYPALDLEWRMYRKEEN